MQRSFQLSKEGCQLKVVNLEAGGGRCVVGVLPLSGGPRTVGPGVRSGATGRDQPRRRPEDHPSDADAASVDDLPDPIAHPASVGDELTAIAGQGPQAANLAQVRTAASARTVANATDAANAPPCAVFEVHHPS